jgi:hypothetical protein
MPLEIALDHPTFLLKNKVQEASKSLLDTFGFNYFQYLRCFADGSISGLTNHTGLFECMRDYENTPVVFSSFEEGHENTYSYWFLWDEELPPTAPLQMAREKFNFHNGLTLVRRTKNYYDMIAVALPYEHPNPGSFYLNKLKAIEQFIYNFDLENKELLALMDKHPIALPNAYRDVNYQKICLTKGKITVVGKHGATYLTSREITCLRFLMQGATYKQIAQLLEISPRTVETYIQRVKQRTGYTSWIEIERMMYLCANS